MSKEVENDNPQDGANASVCVETVTDATAVVRFAIGGALRFLSHAETLRLFEQACSRARVPVKYSQGFNPHPRQSLPLPRAVGVAADDELLVLRVFNAEGFPLSEDEEATRLAWQDRVRTDLSAVLVDGLEIREVHLAKSNVSYQPVSAQYEFVLTRIEGTSDKLANLLAEEHLVMDRVAPGRREARRVDVRPFLKSMRLEGMQVVVECGISNAGSIRVDEIMTLLEIAPTDLAAPIRRTNITWKIT